MAGRVRTLRCGACGTMFKAPASPPVVEIPPEAPPEPAEATAPEPETAAAEPLETPVEAPAKLAAVLYPPIPPKPAQAAPVQAPPMRAAPVRAAPDRALGISILVLVLIIALVLAEHRAIGHAWPPSLRLFYALGLH